MKLVRIIALMALTGLLMTGCKIKLPGDNGPGDNDDFVPVTNIVGVKTSVVVGTVSLGGKVVPSDATNQTIMWSILPNEDDIKGTISGDILTTTKEGDITVRATVENGIAKGKDFIKDIGISVDPFVPVLYIYYSGPANDEVGEIYLDADVYPEDASYTDIVWVVKDAGRTKATINGDVLTTKAEGKVIIRAIIINGAGDGKNYTQDFSIFVSDDDDDDDTDDPD